MEQFKDSSRIMVPVQPFDIRKLKYSFMERKFIFKIVALIFKGKPSQTFTIASMFSNIAMQDFQLQFVSRHCLLLQVV